MFSKNKEDIKNLKSLIGLYRREFIELSSTVRNNYVHKTEFWKMRDAATNDMLREFGREIARIEAIVQTVLDALALQEQVETTCKACGQKLPKEKDCC